MATFLSTQLTNVAAKPIVRLPSRDSHGRIRVAYFDYTQAANGAINDDVQLVELPPGRVRVFSVLSHLVASDKAAGATLNVGWAAYVDPDGVAVAADPNGFFAAVDIATGPTTLTPALLPFKTFDSRDGVILTAQFLVVAPAAADTLEGYFAYVVD